MRLEISSTLVGRLLKEAAASPDREVCGLLFGTAERIELVEICANVADDPRTTFEIDPTALIAAYRSARDSGPAILGCFHSHPGGNSMPSARDAASAEPNDWLWLIVAGSEIALWRAVEGGVMHGRFDPVEWRAV